MKHAIGLALGLSALAFAAAILIAVVAPIRVPFLITILAASRPIPIIPSAMLKTRSQR